MPQAQWKQQWLEWESESSWPVELLWPVCISQHLSLNISQKLLLVSHSCCCQKADLSSLDQQHLGLYSKPTNETLRFGSIFIISYQCNFQKKLTLKILSNYLEARASSSKIQASINFAVKFIVINIKCQGLGKSSLNISLKSLHVFWNINWILIKHKFHQICILKNKNLKKHGKVTCQGYNEYVTFNVAKSDFDGLGELVAFMTTSKYPSENLP